MTEEPQDCKQVVPMPRWSIKFSTLQTKAALATDRLPITVERAWLKMVWSSTECRDETELRQFCKGKNTTTSYFTQRQQLPDNVDQMSYSASKLEKAIKNVKG